MLRHIFPFQGPFPSCQERLAPGGTPCGSTRMPLAEDFQSWSTWVDGFSQHWRFGSVSWGRKIHGTPNKSLRLGHAMDLHGFWILFDFLLFFYLFISCFWIGWWGMKGCSMVRDVDFGSFRPPVAIISLGSRWLHVVDFTTFVGAVHQLKARSRDGSRTWDLRMGGCCWELIQWLSFQDRSCSAQWSTETLIFGPFPEASFEYLARITVNLMGLCHLLVLPNGRRHLRMLFPKQNRDWQADLC